MARAADWLVPAVVALLVFSLAMGSSTVADLSRVGSKLKWVALGLLLAVALFDIVRRKAPRLPWLVYLAAGAIPGLAIVSSAWSVVPRHTFVHSLAFAVEIVGAVAVAQAAVARSGALERVVLAVVAGAGAVALAGFLLAAVSYGDAVQGSGTGAAERFRGIGENPNTVPLLFALVLPLAAWCLWRWWQVPWARAVIGVTLALMVATIAWSGSRGALIAALIGTLVASLTARRLTIRLVWAAATVAVFAVSFVSREVGSPAIPEAAPAPLLAAPKPQPTPAAGTPATAAGGSGSGTVPAAKPSAPGALAGLFPISSRREDEVGNPSLSKIGSASTGSGRLEVWRSTIRIANRRPLLGYGFATENTVFVDRFYFFQGSYVENSYIGAYLQLGLLGVLLLIGGLAVLLLLVLLRFRRLAVQPLAFSCAGVVAAGLTLGAAQSYVYAPGNIGSSTLWLGALLLAAILDRARTARQVGTRASQ